MDRLKHLEFDRNYQRADGQEFTVHNTVLSDDQGNSVVVAKTDPENQANLHQYVERNMNEVSAEAEKEWGEPLDQGKMKYLERTPDGDFQRNLEQGPDAPGDNQPVNRQQLAESVSAMEQNQSIDLSQESFPKREF